MLMVPYRQTRLRQLPMQNSSNGSKTLLQESETHSVTTRTLLGAGGGHGSVGADSAFGRQLSSGSRQAGPNRC